MPGRHKPIVSQELFDECQEARKGPLVLHSKTQKRSRAGCASDPVSYMATPIGFEPTISTVTGWHVNRYTTGPLIATP